MIYRNPFLKIDEEFVKTVQKINENAALVDAISKKYNIEPSMASDLLNQGATVEHEHTDDNEVAKKIASDHLLEDIKYYEKLKNCVENK